MKVDFDALTPEARALLLVASDEKYRALVAQVDFLKIAKLAAPLLIPGGLVGALFGPAAATSVYLASTWAVAGASRPPGEAPSLFDRLVRKGEIPIPHLAPDEAARRFRFDSGEPRDGAAYLLNPYARDHYLAPALANERIAQEKLAGFLRVGAALGAKTIEILSADAMRHGGHAAADVPLPQRATQIGLRARFDQAGAVTRQVLVELDPPRAPPHVPDAMRAFVDADPVLRALVATRLEARPRRARVALEFGDAIDVDAALTEGLARRGVSVGGQYRKVAASVWSFEIAFWPAPGEDG